MTEKETEAERLLRRLAGRRALARLAILFELVWPVLWPPLGVAGLFVCLALLNVPRLLPPWGQVGLLAAAVLAVIVLLARGVRGLASPDAAAADRRLEHASGLRHRPLSVLADHPANADEAGAALWHAHVARAARQIRRLRVGLPRPGLARHDRRALRGALVVGLVACAGIAGEDAPARVWAALRPTLPRGAAGPGTEVQAWVTPPAYTHVAPLFLKPGLAAFAAPTGSHLIVSVTGGNGAPRLNLAGQSAPFRSLDSASFQAERDLTAGGHLAIRRNGGELAGWDVTITPDQPPAATWAAPPGASRSGQRTRLPWRATDDYGVVSLRAEIRLRDRKDAPPLSIAIPLPGGDPKEAHGVAEQDLTANPWAGLPVVARLVARDAVKQEGTSDEAQFVLPERVFRNPVARALIAIRKGLSLRPDDRETAVGGLDALLVKPEALGGDVGAYVNLSSLYYRLEFDQSPGAIGEVQEQMWRLALHLEEGATSRTARELEAARKAAQDALERTRHDPTAAHRAELERKLRALEEAIQRHMQALAEQLQSRHEEMPFDPQSRQLSGREMERLAEQAREAAKAGRMDEAEQRMAQLERMLNQLRNARPMTAEERRRAAQRQKGHQQMGALQDMIGRQGGLLDHSQSRARDRRGDAQDEQKQGDQPADSSAAQGQEADRRVQQALRRALGEMMQQFGDLTGKIPPSLGEADQAMQSAAQALSQGRDQAAGRSQTKAIEALQKGGREMGQQMASQFGQSGQQSGENDGEEMGMSLSDSQGEGDADGDSSLTDGQAGRGRDPLGRRYGQGGNGVDESNDVTVPDHGERKRTEEIEQELRRRGADLTRPQEELDYINRLLKQF